MEDTSRSIRWVFALIAVGAAVTGVLLFSYGDGTLAGAGFVLLLLGVPVLGYVAWIKTRIGSIMVGIGLVGLVVSVQAYVTSRGGSSTAAVGYLYLIGLGVILLALAVALERIFGACG